MRVGEPLPAFDAGEMEAVVEALPVTTLESSDAVMPHCIMSPYETLRAASCRIADVRSGEH